MWLPLNCPLPDYPFWQLKPPTHGFARILAYLRSLPPQGVLVYLICLPTSSPSVFGFSFLLGWMFHLSPADKPTLFPGHPRALSRASCPPSLSIWSYVGGGWIRTRAWTKAWTRALRDGCKSPSNQGTKERHVGIMGPAGPSVRTALYNYKVFWQPRTPDPHNQPRSSLLGHVKKLRLREFL